MIEEGCFVLWVGQHGLSTSRVNVEEAADLAEMYPSVIFTVINVTISTDI